MKFALVILCMLVSMAVAQECQSFPCQQFGSCTEDDYGYLCFCPVPYTGQNCEIRTSSTPICSMTYSSTVGNITSPYYPDNYPDNITCNYHLKIPNAMEITLILVDFHTDQMVDTLTIGKGPTVLTSGADVFELLGNFTDVPVKNRTFRFLSNQVFLHFVTDTINNAKGFLISYSAAVECPCLNGGSCFADPNNGFRCTCPAEYTGLRCEIGTINGNCQLEYCNGAGTCFGISGDFLFCECFPGFSGEECTIDLRCLSVTVETVFGQARLPMAEVGDMVDSEEICPGEDSEALETSIIRGVCQMESNGTTYWNTSIRCQDDITRQLQWILQNGIANANVHEVALNVSLITQNYDDITAIDIGLLYEILQLIDDLNSTNANVTDLIVGIVNNVIYVEEDVLASAQENGNSTTLIVQILESQLNTVYVGNTTLETAYPNIAVQVLDLPSDTAGDGIVVTMFNMDTGNLSNSDIMVGTHQETPIDTVQRDTFARVVVPIEVAQAFATPDAMEGPSGSNNTSSGDNFGTATPPGVSTSPEETVGESTIDSLRIAFVVYVSDAMFPSQRLAQLNQETQKVNRQVNTPVVSLTVGGQKIENLMERVNITFFRFESDSRDPTCNFWEFSLGKWSMTGCQLLPDNTMVVNSSEDEYYICTCDHLTNFAVLVDIYAVDEPPKPVLRLLSIIGCAISCVCLVIAIVSYLSVKKVRKSQTHKIFICLCTTLLCLYIASLAIIALDTEYQYAELEWIPCTVLAALVHFFVLSSLTWMGIEGFNTYLIIIRVFDTYIPRFMIKAAIVGWGIPAVIVGVTGGITRNTYAVEDYCYIRRWPLIGGLLIPMAIILIINITVFILAMCRLEHSARMAGRVKKDRKAERKETVERIQNGIAMLILLGFTWTTGYLTLINVDIADLLFIVSNSLQGFFIFVLYCLRKATIRKQWRRCICCALFREDGSSESQRSSGQTPGSRPTSGTEGSQPMSESESAMSHTNPAYYH